jgi:hypothetical protein
MPGIVYSYETLILPPEFQTLAEDARSVLGYPVLVGARAYVKSLSSRVKILCKLKKLL